MIASKKELTLGFSEALGGTESDVAQFLAQHRWLLAARVYPSNLYAIREFRFGSDYVADFAIVYRITGTFAWEFVELESPTARLFNKAGDPTAVLSHAIRQVQDWKTWIDSNSTYSLLGTIIGLSFRIVIGRRESIQPSSEALLNRLNKDIQHVTIHTYDRLLNILENAEDSVIEEFEGRGPALGFANFRREALPMLHEGWRPL